MKRTQKQASGMRKLFGYCKKHALALVIVVVVSIVSVCLTVYGTTFLKTLTNYIDAAAKQVQANAAIPMKDVLDMSYVIRLCLTLGAMYVGAAVCGFLQGYIMSSVNQRVSKRLRQDLSTKISRLPISYFDARKIGDTLSRMTNDVDTVAQSLNAAVSVTVSSAFQLVLVAVVMFAARWEMALTAVATVPLSLVITFLVVRVSQKYFRQQQHELGALNGVAEESYSGLAIIRAFNAQGRMTAQFDEKNRLLKRAMYRANVLSALTHPLMTFVSKLGYVAVCVVGGILMSRNVTDLGTLAAFLIYINLFQSPLGQLGQIANMFQTASAAADRIFEFLEAEEQSDEREKTARLDPTKVRGQVEFRNVKFGYTKDMPIIHNFSAMVGAGKKVAVIGPTGAGKTTLVNLLMRYYETDAGDILIDGVSIKDMPRDSVRALFSMVLQDTWLFDGTVRDNIAYGVAVSDERFAAVARDAEIDHFIASLPDGDQTRLSEDGLSSGQKQLMTIARAMLKDAPMMILDEATSNVDTSTEESIQAAMDRLTANKTSFVIAHRLSTIRNADLILVLKDGDIIEQGTHTDLLAAQGFYATLYNSQFARANSASIAAASVC